MYFEDLSPYEYLRRPADAAIVNVGWLSVDHSYETGDVAAEFLEAVRRLVASPVNLTRGVHECEFCPSPMTTRNGAPWYQPVPGSTGNGEIRIVGNDGRTYVAPVLLLHYLEAHRYRPPVAFIAAVLGSGPDIRQR
jgi:hypothetical protein